MLKDCSSETNGFIRAISSFNIYLISVTPVAGLIFETKNRAVFLERFFWRDFHSINGFIRAISSFNIYLISVRPGERIFQEDFSKPRQNGRKMTSFRGTWAVWPSWELAWTMNWVDRLRTRADKRMWSGRRAVVMRTGRRAELLGVKLGCPRSR